MAFPRDQRLRESRLIHMLLKKGERKQTPFFRCHALPSHSGVTKIAVVVSSKIEASAAKRNRIRRRISEAVMGVLSETGNKSPQLLLFLGNSAVLEANFEELQKQVQNALLSS